MHHADSFAKASMGMRIHFCPFIRIFTKPTGLMDLIHAKENLHQGGLFCTILTDSPKISPFSERN